MPSKRNLKRKKIKTKKKSLKMFRRTIKRGGNKGNNLRQQLVNACKQNDWNEYNRITDEIISDYINGDKSFFIHLNRNFHTFKPETKKCLELALTRAQEETIPESMSHLYSIMQMTGKAPM